MKKLVVLALVLAVSSMAFGATADLEILVNGGAYAGGDIFEGDVVTLNLLELDGAPGNFGNDFVLSASGAASYVANSFEAVPSGLAVLGVLTLQDLGNGAQVTGPQTAFFGDALLSGGRLITIAVDAAEVGVINYSVAGVYGGVAQDIAGSINVVEIPEPMTVMLLGLGGLFLRRRK